MSKVYKKGLEQEIEILKNNSKSLEIELETYKKAYWTLKIFVNSFDDNVKSDSIKQLINLNL
tara:strand:- start:8577 stop:8762 length:186 start_codon:yes stop_codon:yes gene_type:complete